MAPVINLKSIGSATSGARATSARTSILDWIAVRTGRLSPGRDVAVTFRSNTGGSVVHIAGRDPARVHASSAATLWRGVFFDGVLYNRRALEVECGESHRRLSDAMLLLRAWQFFGGDWLTHVKGVFALLAWDSTSDTLTAVRDPLGTYPLFYAKGASGLMLSTSMTALAGRDGVSRAVNRPALADHLAHRWPDPHETFLAAIRRVPAGHRLDVSPARQVVRRYWDPTPLDKEIDWIREGELDRFDDLLDNAVARCYRQGPASVFLSGGLDSISVAAVAADGARRDHYPDPLTLSLASSSSDVSGSVPDGLSEFLSEAALPEATRRDAAGSEVRETAPDAVQVARALGLNHEVLRLDDGVGREGVVEEALRLTKGWPTPILNTWLPTYARLAERSRRHGVSVMMTGRGRNGWLSLNPYFSADLMTRVNVVAWCRFITSWKRSSEESWPQLVRSAFSPYGAKPLASSVMDRVFPAPWRLSRVRREMRQVPRWVAPDRLFRRELWDRAQQALMPLHPARGYYLQDLRSSMDQALLSLELEENYELGRRLGVKILNPYWDADLVGMLCRTPPHLINRGGRPRKLVLTSVARRFPALALGTPTFDCTPSLFRAALATEADAEWKRLGGVEALADLKIVDPIATAKVFASQTTSASSVDRLWDILSAETWARSHA